MLTGGVRVSSENLGPKAAETKLVKRAEKQVPCSELLAERFLTQSITHAHIRW